MTRTLHIASLLSMTIARTSAHSSDLDLTLREAPGPASSASGAVDGASGRLRGGGPRDRDGDGRTGRAGDGGSDRGRVVGAVVWSSCRGRGRRCRGRGRRCLVGGRRCRGRVSRAPTTTTRHRRPRRCTETTDTAPTTRPRHRRPRPRHRRHDHGTDDQRPRHRRPRPRHRRPRPRSLPPSPHDGAAITITVPAVLLP